MLFYIRSSLASIYRGLARYSISDHTLAVSAEGLACYSIPYHALAVSAEAWHAIAAILYLVTPWQYLQRLGMLFYILLRLGSICTGLACYSIFYHTLAVSAGAWHTILYLITPWQYPPRLGILFYI